MNYTAEQIQQMPAGDEMNELIALYVMGWERSETIPGYDTVDGNIWWHDPRAGVWMSHPVFPDWSGDIAAAWQAVEKMTDQADDNWFYFNMRRIDSWDRAEWGYEVVFGIPYTNGKKEWKAWGNTAPCAIGRAALLEKLEAG